MLVIDGAMGEGGGQILRSALGLSLVTGKAFRIDNIRANREKPGLMRQHLIAVQSAAELCGARVDGAELHSRRLTFEPGEVRPGEYSFSIGSAGSTTLVLQTVLPPLLMARERSVLMLEGGTHNPFAPPLDFLQRAFLPLVERMGAGVRVDLERPGFYPAGGGAFTVTIDPKPLTPVHVDERGAIVHQLCRVMLAGLPGHIADREIDVVRRRLGWLAEQCHTQEWPHEYGPGNVVILEVACEQVTEVFVGFGQRGVRAEEVARRAVSECEAWLAAGAPVGPHLADQLLIPMALAGGGSYVTMSLTDHTVTNIQVVEMFLDVTIRAEQVDGGAWRIAL